MSRKRQFEKLPKRLPLDDELNEVSKPKKVEKVFEEKSEVPISMKMIQKMTMRDMPKKAISTSFAVDKKTEESEDEEEEIPEDETMIPEEDITEEDAAALDKFLNDDGILDQITDRIATARSEIASQLDDGDMNAVDDLPPELTKHVGLLRKVLASYKTGPLPKTLKMLPQLGGWDTLLEMLKPDEWTAAAMSAMTKHFSAKGNVQAMHFYNNYLLPRIRDEIHHYRRLNFHSTRAVTHALYRQKEFLIGILIPMCSDNLSLTEAAVMCGVLKKVSIPVRFSAAALALILPLEFSVPRCSVIFTLIDKKYKLPEAVLTGNGRTSICGFFKRFNSDCTSLFTSEGRLPVVWFQTLLLFLQLYKESLKSADRDELLALCRRHSHPSITREVKQILRSIPDDS